MKVGVYAVRDVKADAFMQVWNSPTDGVASRNFAASVKDKESAFSRNPEDFALYKLGTFDDASGEIVGSRPQLVCTAVSCLG